MSTSPYTALDHSYTGIKHGHYNHLAPSDSYASTWKCAHKAQKAIDLLLFLSPANEEHKHKNPWNLLPIEKRISEGTKAVWLMGLLDSRTIKLGSWRSDIKSLKNAWLPAKLFNSEFQAMSSRSHNHLPATSLGSSVFWRALPTDL